MIVSWSAFKGFVQSRSLSIQMAEDSESYCLTIQGGVFSCIILKSNKNEDLSDFETNFKAQANKDIASSVEVKSSPAFAAKVIYINGVQKKLYARYVGVQFPVIAGSNDLVWSSTFPHAKMIGVEVVNSESLDTASFKVHDTPAGTYSGVPDKMLDQFSFNVNLPSGYYVRMASFDADVYFGMKFKISYASASAKTIGINFILHEVV